VEGGYSVLRKGRRNEKRQKERIWEMNERKKLTRMKKKRG